MTENVHGIGINTGSVNLYKNQAKGNDAKPEETKPEAQPQAPSSQQVKPDDVLSYMANTAAVVNPQVAPRTYNVSKYVTPEQAARIAGFVTSFEDQVAEGLLAIDKEFGEKSNISDQAKYEIAAGMVK